MLASNRMSAIQNSDLAKLKLPDEDQTSPRDGGESTKTPRSSRRSAKGSIKRTRSSHLMSFRSEIFLAVFLFPGLCQHGVIYVLCLAYTRPNDHGAYFAFKQPCAYIAPKQPQRMYYYFPTSEHTIYINAIHYQRTIIAH